VKIYATVQSDAAEKYILSGEYPMKKIEISVENYKRFQGNNELEDYYQIEQYIARRNTSLIQNVEFIKDDLNFSHAPKNVKLILMRNAMIYFTPSYQEIILKKMHEVLSANGSFIIGLQENIDRDQNTHSLFEAVELSESVYKKRIS
jgi:chemotaxis methyl-accepting protein methylase